MEIRMRWEFSGAARCGALRGARVCGGAAAVRVLAAGSAQRFAAAVSAGAGAAVAPRAMPRATARTRKVVGGGGGVGRHRRCVARNQNGVGPQHAR